jgi:hypothetical protein
VIFLHPLALLGLAAAAIPALLHLLGRRAPPELVFPPLRYLTEAERQTARRLKLRHLLLLLLRTAVIVLIVLAAARPLVPAGAHAAGSHAPTALAVILDNSPSAAAVVDGRVVLERLRAVARGSLAGAGPDDRLWLVLADGVARAGTREMLLGAVDSVRAADRRLDVTAAVREAVRLVAAEPLAAREVHVVSDLQRSALGPGRVEVPRGVRVLALAPPERVPPNRGIGAVTVAPGGVVVTVVGTPGAPPATVTVRVGGWGVGRELGRGLAAPGSAVVVPLPPLPPGWWTGEVTLDPDELRADDRRLFAWRVLPPVGVTAARDAGPFVVAALAVLGEGRRVRPGTDVTVGTEAAGAAAAAAASIVLPPADPAELGRVNRALAARGVRWRFAGPGTPGPIASAVLPEAAGLEVMRRQRLEPAPGAADSAAVLATVNGEPWLVRDTGAVLVGSRLDTAWTALPQAAAFVPFVDALLARVARGVAPVADAEGAPRVEFRVRGADTVGATVYGLDPAESDLTPAPRDLVHDVLGAEVLDARAFAAARFAGPGRRDMSGPLLVLAVLAVVAELGVAGMTR